MRVYRVNHDYPYQFSIWPDPHKPFADWIDTGQQGSLSDCMAYVRALWTQREPAAPVQPSIAKETSSWN